MLLQHLPLYKLLVAIFIFAYQLIRRYSLALLQGFKQKREQVSAICPAAVRILSLLIIVNQHLCWYFVFVQLSARDETFKKVCPGYIHTLARCGPDRIRNAGF
jgi:hypothetical protein